MHFTSRARLACLSLVLLGFTACSEDFATSPDSPKSTLQFMSSPQPGLTYTVSSMPDQPGVFFDHRLTDAYDLDADQAGRIWIAAKGSGHVLAYDQFGSPMHEPIVAPQATAVAASGAQNFMIEGQGPAELIIASADGSISAWSADKLPMVVASSQLGGEYTGLAIVSNPRGTEHYLYAADFRNGKIDVYDRNFLKVEGMAFVDPAVPEGFAPYNVAAVGPMLYVAYAFRKDGQILTGPGLGFVSAFSMRGQFIRRLPSSAELNAPYGIAASAPNGMGLYGTLYISNTGDGSISTYDSQGNFTGWVQGGGGQIMIDGVKGVLSGDPAKYPGLDPNLLFFASGPSGGLHGAFGNYRNMNGGELADK